jgi:hypothetical protein
MADRSTEPSGFARVFGPLLGLLAYASIAGEHARAAHDDLVAVSPPHDRGPVR